MLACSLVFAAATIVGAVETGEASFHPTTEEANVPAQFRLEAATFPFEIQPLRETSEYKVSAVRFPSPVDSPDVENNTVHAEYFRPTIPGKRPTVIVLHILGADFALSRYLAARLADRGVGALFVKLPYYGERRPAGQEKRFLSTDIPRTVQSMRQGVCDVRRAAAWLASREEVDATKLGVTGISLGGIVSALAAEVDPTLNQTALMLAGGDLAQILWTMPEGAKYRQLWIDSGRTRADLEALTLPFDPVTHGGRLRHKRVFMLSGNIDEVVPPESAVALWKAAGKPPIRWMDCGHYSAAGYLLPAMREVVDFFAGDENP
jgi:cephalosporin-C deacetylase-like acetyl esterase